MPFTKLQFFYLLTGILISVNTSAQLEILEFPKEKRVIAIEARAGYYWDLGSLPDSLQLPMKNYYEKLMKGPRYDFSILYNWNDNLDVGFTYSLFNAHSQAEVGSYTYMGNNGTQWQLYGRLQGQVRQQYFSLRVDPSFQVGEFFYIKPGVSSGVLIYQSEENLDTLRVSVSGSAMVFELHLGLEYFVDNNWSLNLLGSYQLGILHEPEIENTLEAMSSENLSASLFKWHVGLGIRYNFTKKGYAAPSPRKNELPQRIEKPGRFD